jgi:hypothetical protein
MRCALTDTVCALFVKSTQSIILDIICRGAIVGALGDGTGAAFGGWAD